MSTCARLTSLPWNVITHILHHVGNTCMYGQHVDQLAHVGITRLYMPLLALGPTWRMLVAKRLSAMVHLVINSDNESSSIFPDYFELACESDIRLLKSVQSAKLNVQLEDIFSGYAAEYLQQLASNHVVFSRSVKLTISISEGYHQTSLVRDHSLTNLCKFVSSLQLVFPKVPNIHIDHQCWSGTVNHNYLLCISKLANHLIKGDMQLGLNFSADDVPFGLHPHPITRLSSISCIWRRNIEQTCALIRQNADTLLDLKIRFVVDPQERILKLFKDNDSIFTKYPCLQKIYFAASIDLELLSRPTCQHIAPFPALKHISMKMDYPFGDNILFRQNSDHLETIDITTNVDILRVLIKQATTQNGGFNSLKYVKASESFDFNSGNPIYSEMLSVLAHTANRTIRVFEFDVPFILDDLLPAIMTDKSLFTNMHSLIIPRCPLTLADTVMLLGCLPQLTDICSMFGGLGHDYIYIPTSNVVDHLIYTYASLRSCFRCWRLKYNNGVNMNDVVTSTIVLASLCPQFLCLAVDTIDVKEYYAAIKRAIRMDELANYVNLLQQICQRVKHFI